MSDWNGKYAHLDYPVHAEIIGHYRPAGEGWRHRLRLADGTGFTTGPGGRVLDIDLPEALAAHRGLFRRSRRGGWTFGGHRVIAAEHADEARRSGCTCVEAYTKHLEGQR